MDRRRPFVIVMNLLFHLFASNRRQFLKKLKPIHWTGFCYSYWLATDHLIVKDRCRPFYSRRYVWSRRSVVVPFFEKFKSVYFFGDVLNRILLWHPGGEIWGWAFVVLALRGRIAGLTGLTVTLQASMVANIHETLFLLAFHALTVNAYTLTTNIKNALNGLSVPGARW